MGLHSYFGNKSFDVVFGKTINNVINSYLKKVTDIDFDYEFEIKSRHANDDEYYNWIVEVYTDIPLPRTFNYNDEYKIKKKLDGFHHSILSNEIKDMLSNIGVDTRSFGNTVGVKLKNLK
jgi:hypothetical protein